jgi:polar amino acid transport system substrate-binding protein
MMVLLALAFAFTGLCASPLRAETPDEALAQLLKQARSTVPAACSDPNADRLIKILCEKRIRIGVRDYYPLFAMRDGAKREGYEVDVALAIGRMLGVDVDFVRVNAATRIPLLAEDRIDLAIATMGHNSLRDGQVRFIRPHYYRSETTVSAGAYRVRDRRQPLERRAGVPGRSPHAVRRGGGAARASQGSDLHAGGAG